MSEIKLILNKDDIGGDIEVEKDYFTAAFLFAAGIIAGGTELSIKGLKWPSSQKNARIIDILKQMNADIHFSDNKFIIKKSALRAVGIDAKDILSLVPILMVVASQAEGKTIIKITENTQKDKPDQIKMTVEELKKMGANIVENKDHLEIIGPTQLKGTIISTRNCDRTVMAITIAALVANDNTILQDPVCVKRSYPGFFDDMRQIGMNPIPITAPFGEKIKLLIYGDSHGKKIGLLLSGIEENIKITSKDIQEEVDKRRSVSNLSTPRQEEDKVRIIEGIKDGHTTGETIRIEILNKDTHSAPYKQMKNISRPGHADFTARTKYASIFDYRGGGFASGRMTVCMVTAGAIAKKILKDKGVKIFAYTKQIGKIAMDKELNLEEIENNTYSNYVRCPDKKTAELMVKEIEKARDKNDSVGGIVEGVMIGLPTGLGEPLFNSVESIISHAMFSIPAVKAIEFGSGFKAAQMKGSLHNDSLNFDKNNKLSTDTNNAGGILGGITNSMPVVFRIAVKPTSSIGIKQDSINIKTAENIKITVQGRHDPCIAIRVPPIVEAMSAISILDLYLRESQC